MEGAGSYAARGESDTVNEVKDKESPFATAFEAVRAPEKRKLPAVEASHADRWVTVSDAVIE